MSYWNYGELTSNIREIILQINFSLSKMFHMHGYIIKQQFW